MIEPTVVQNYANIINGFKNVINVITTIIIVLFSRYFIIKQLDVEILARE